MKRSVVFTVVCRTCKREIRYVETQFSFVRCPGCGTDVLIGGQYEPGIRS
jgi:predicted RNA-binding Zn-ribbon protein involved in translation (DUF1610 family)